MSETVDKDTSPSVTILWCTKIGPTGTSIYNRETEIVKNFLKQAKKEGAIYL
jgi:hypothetical protein